MDEPTQVSPPSVTSADSESNQMKATRLELSLAACVIGLCSACTNITEFRKFNGHVEEFSRDERYVGTFRRVPDSNVLLEVYRFAGNPFIPTAWGGYSLFIEGSPEVLQPNTIIRIPGDNLDVMLYRDYHHLGHFQRGFIGEIRILEVGPEHIEAAIHLELEGTNERFDLTARFKQRDIAEYARIEP